MADWSKLTDTEVGEAYACAVKVVSDAEKQLVLYKSVKSNAEFEFLIRFDEETRKQWGFIVGKN